MPEIISNSSCLIVLDNIEMLFTLRNLYGKIVICEEVQNEFGKDVEDWIEVRQVNNRNCLRALHNLVDLGEAETIALSLEMPDSVIILDDLKARKLAKNLHLKFTGTLGILLKAKQQGIIKTLAPVLHKLKSAHFRISQAMENEVLRLANESE